MYQISLISVDSEGNKSLLPIDKQEFTSSKPE